MLETLFAMDPLDGLDEFQRAAASAPQGYTKIIAGAGTGKTTTLTARIAYLINSGVPADEICAVTFTNKAAKELRERVEKKVGDKAAALRLGTFHSLSGRILRRHCHLADLRKDYAIADEDDVKHLTVIASQVHGAFGSFVAPENSDEAETKNLKKEWEAGLKAFADRAVHQISLWKGFGLTSAIASDPAREERGEEDERFAVAYSAYQYELEARNLADFGDLILKTVTILKNHPDVLRTESSAIRHLLVDEAQDANSVQVEWARLVSSFHGGLTVVGDDDQNIYGFQGGYPGAIDDMAGSTALTFVLKTNRRCTDEILHPANVIVDYNRRKQPKSLTSGRSGTAVGATGHPTDINEAAWIAGRVAELVEAGTSPDQIAILFRTAFLMPAYEEAILRKGIPSVVMSGNSLLSKEEVRDVMAMVRMAVNPYDDLSFQRVANRPARALGTTAVEALISLSQSRSIPFHEACLLAADSKSGIGLRKDAREGALNLGKALAALAEEGEWLNHTHDIITTALEKTGYLEWLQTQDGADKKVSNIDALHRLSDAYEDATEFLQEVSLLTDEESSKRDLTGKVRLSTIHSVKGLEFDHVFCPAFDDGVMPNARAVEEGRKGKVGDLWNGPHGGGLEEERRLAHVAFTRARHGLHVSFSWRRGHHKKGKAGGPSSFMEECEFKWEEMGAASTADLGRKKTTKKWSSQAGFRR